MKSDAAVAIDGRSLENHPHGRGGLRYYYRPSSTVMLVAHVPLLRIAPTGAEALATLEAAREQGCREDLSAHIPRPKRRSRSTGALRRGSVIVCYTTHLIPLLYSG